MNIPKGYNPNNFVTCPGNKHHILYAPRVRADGTIELQKSGIEDTDAYIQSFAESTDMSFIIAKLSAGDTSVLNQRVGSYGDFTNLPKNFAEVLQMQIDAKRTFETLPVDVKKKFDNDVNKFLVSAGSADWFNNLKDYLPDNIKNTVFPENNNNVEVNKDES